MPHEPDRFNPRGGPNTADHVDILGRSSLNDLILRVAGGKGHFIQDNIVSNILEYAEKVKIGPDYEGEERVGDAKPLKKGEADAVSLHPEDEVPSGGEEEKVDDEKKGGPVTNTDGEAGEKSVDDDDEKGGAGTNTDGEASGMEKTGEKTTETTEEDAKGKGKDASADKDEL